MAMSKNIILLSDGTGNSSSKLFKTNVWRMFQALDLTDPDAQVAYYDNGVGTSSFKPLAILGGVFGFGLKRNVIDIYSFCCRNYQPGDKIFGFGFSRGAFTIRVVAGFIARIGLIPYDGNEAQLARDAEIAYREYRKVRNFKSGGNILIGPLRKLRDWVSHVVFRKPTFKQLEEGDDQRKPLIRIDKLHFLGVWDTVDAYGGPIDEITRAIDYWYWPLSMPDRFMTSRINRACHALALEDERDSFRPVLWDDRYVREGDKLYPVDHNWKPPPSAADTPLADIDRERISQVWFVGVHCDIGGGYAQDGLAYKTLQWMMERAGIYGLKYTKLQQDYLETFVNPYDKLNDSRHGIAGYYRYRPRKLSVINSQPPNKLSLREDFRHIINIFKCRENPEHEVKAELASPQFYAARPAPKIHRSVLDRIEKGTDGYSPIVLPEEYNVVEHNGAITPNANTEPSRASRASLQEKAWDWVWARRITYFLTVFASLYLAALPLIEKWRPGRGAASPAEIIVPVIDVIGAFLPNFVKPWLDAFRNSPGRFLFGVLLVAILMYAGGWMQGKIRDLMRTIWKKPSPLAPRPEGIVYKIRSAGPYLAFFYLLKHWILPTIFAALIFVILLYAGFCLISRVSFTWFDATGHVCTSTAPAVAVTAKSVPRSFETKALCTPTGLAVKKGSTYEVVLTVTEPWEDGYKFMESDPRKAKGIETGPEGFGYDKMRPAMYLGLPLRRQIASNWFATILRADNKGFGEVTPVFIRDESPGSSGLPRYKATFKAPRDGEIFVYVNDSVVGLPGYFDLFYREDAWTRMTNKGKADLTIELLNK
jgi:uncharacterized protein (DUF2235 family)